MRILVAGGAGYLGSVTSELLLRAGHDVTVIDNLVRGHRAAVPRDATFIREDLRDLARVREVVERCRPEAVFHFAGHAQVGESMGDPFQYLGDNSTMSVNLFQAAAEQGVRRIVFTSSSNLFERADRTPIDEDAAPRPGSPYGESKWYLERTLAWLEKTHGIHSAVLRCFNAAGATPDRGEDHEPETHLIPLILQAAQGRRPAVPILGTDWETPDGTCIRDYVHVSDVAEAHLLALGAIDGRSRTYNLGNGTGTSVAQVLDSARRVTGKPIPTLAVPRRAGDPARLVADSSRIRRELGWKPRIPEIDRIVETAWTWMLSHPDGYPK